MRGIPQRLTTAARSETGAGNCTKRSPKDRWHKDMMTNGANTENRPYTQKDVKRWRLFVNDLIRCEKEENRDQSSNNRHDKRERLKAFPKQLSDKASESTAVFPKLGNLKPQFSLFDQFLVGKKIHDRPKISRKFIPQTLQPVERNKVRVLKKVKGNIVDTITPIFRTIKQCFKKHS